MSNDYACALLVRAGRLLLGLRAPERRLYPSRWDVLGGRVEPGETLAQALSRELGEELGIDPEELGGSAWTAAITSFILFAIGAIIPVLAFVFWTGTHAIFISIILSTLGLFLLGAAITLFTGRSVVYSGMRMVIFGLVAAAITFGIGKLIGVSIAG